MNVVLPIVSVCVCMCVYVCMLCVLLCTRDVYVVLRIVCVCFVCMYIYVVFEVTTMKCSVYSSYYVV